METEERGSMFTSGKYQDNKSHWHQLVTMSMNNLYPQQHETDTDTVTWSWQVVKEDEGDTEIIGMIGGEHHIWKAIMGLILEEGMDLSI